MYKTQIHVAMIRLMNKTIRKLVDSMCGQYRHRLHKAYNMRLTRLYNRFTFIIKILDARCKTLFNV